MSCNSISLQQNEMGELLPMGDCVKTGNQFADICVPIEIKPDTKVGRIETTCCGEPTLTCVQNPSQKTCEITITQKIRIKIPVSIKIISCVGKSSIDCADD